MFDERDALDHMFSAAYEELRRLASTVLRGEQSATLNPTALVHEAWLKLANSPELAPVSHLHFKRIAARAMRQLLIEAARRRNARKRGGGAEGIVFVTFSDSVPGPCCEDDLIALDAALLELEQFNPRQAQLVEVRFFAGLSVTETTELLGISETTVHREWRLARAWLLHKIRQDR